MGGWPMSTHSVGGRWGMEGGGGVGREERRKEGKRERETRLGEGKGFSQGEGCCGSVVVW